MDLLIRVFTSRVHYTCICCELWRETSILAGLLKMRWRLDIYGMSLVTCI